MLVLACSFWEDLDVFKVDGLLGEELDSALDWEAALAETFLNWILLVDLDPQGNASTGLGVEVDERRLTTYELLLEDIDLAEVVLIDVILLNTSSS